MSDVRKQSAGHVLDRSEDRYRALLDAAPDGIVIADADGVIVLVNALTERLFGYRRDELAGQPVETLLPEGVRSAHRGHRAGYLGEPRTRQMGAGLELVGRRKDGSEFPVDISLSPLETGEGILVMASVRDVTERKHAEAVLREAQDRFRGAFDSAAIGMALVAPDGRFLQVNPSLCGLVGYSEDKLLSKTFQEITHPDDLDADLEFVRQMLADELRTYQMEKRYLDKQGKIVWILLSVSLVRDWQGEPLYFVSQIQDITERKLAQDAIEESKERLAEAQSIAHVGSWELLEDGGITGSDELYRIWGWEPGAVELTRERFIEAMHPDDRPSVERGLARARANREYFSVEYRLVRPDGSVRWVHSQGAPVTNDGNPLRMRGTAQDVTERKEAEERLLEAERRFRTLVEQLPLATYIRPLDMAFPNVYASPQVEPMLGYTAEEWQSNPDLLGAIVHPDDRERILEAAAHVRKTGEPIRQEYRYLARAGHVVWVLDETYLVHDEHGQPWVQGYLLDITERKRAEEERDGLQQELHHAQKLEALGRLAGGVAHDFNNMLTVIRGYSELLLDGLDPSDPLCTEAEQISRAVVQASALPKRLLAFSRKQVLEPKLVDLNEIVSAMSDLLRRVIGEAVELVTISDAESAWTLVDPGQVEQALVNLALNACDAMPAGGTLTIETSNRDMAEEAAADHEVAPGVYAVVSVSDTGQGMDAATKARAFEPFFTTKTPGQGSGLGLATVYGIVKQSGGFIDVTSEPGEGATFGLAFPAARAEVGPEPMLATAAPVADVSRATVLLVEDQKLVRDVVGAALERAGYHVLTAATGAEALELCEQPDAEIGALLTDMVMPGMGGRELAQHVLELRPDTPVVFMSGYTDEAPPDRDDWDAASFLQKPFSPRDLVSVVQAAVERRPVPNGVGASQPAAATISCLIADDHPAVLDSVGRFLASQGIEVVSRVSRGDEALSEIENRRPAVAVLDVGMAPLTGIEVAARAARAAPETRAVLYTGHRDESLLEQALGAGARGFVLKDAPLSDLVRAIRAVSIGGTYVDPELSGALASAGVKSAKSTLTRREREVLSLLADGMTNERAGASLGIAAETVQSHVRNAMEKLEADTRTQAVAAAIRQSLIE